MSKEPKTIASTVAENFAYDKVTGEDYPALAEVRTKQSFARDKLYRMRVKDAGEEQTVYEVFWKKAKYSDPNQEKMDFERPGPRAVTG